MFVSPVFVSWLVFAVPVLSTPSSGVRRVTIRIPTGGKVGLLGRGRPLRTRPARLRLLEVVISETMAFNDYLK